MGCQQFLLFLAGHPGPGRQQIAEALQLSWLDRPYGRETL
jgi:hypothetical protein